jgi:hypothetical protein
VAASRVLTALKNMTKDEKTLLVLHMRMAVCTSPFQDKKHGY